MPDPSKRLWGSIGGIVMVVIIAILTVQYARAKVQPHYNAAISDIQFTGQEPYIFLQNHGEGTNGDESIASPSLEIITAQGERVIGSLNYLDVEYVAPEKILITKWSNDKRDQWLTYFYINNQLQELVLPDSIRFSETGPQQITESPSGKYLFVHNIQDWYVYDYAIQQWRKIDHSHIPKTDHDVVVEWSATDEHALYINVKDYNDDGSLGTDVARHVYNPEVNIWQDVGIEANYEMQVLPKFFSDRILCPYATNTIIDTSSSMHEILCDADKLERYDFTIHNPWFGKQTISVVDHETNQEQEFSIGFSLFEHDEIAAEWLGDSRKLAVYAKRELGVLDITTGQYAKLKDIIHWEMNGMRLQDITVLPQYE